MKTFQSLRTLFPIAIAALLTACGGTDPASVTVVQTAAYVQTATATANNAVNVPATAAPASTEPQPDCAPEGCRGLRIIDGNAEAYRLAAMERKKRDAQNPDA
jgi:carbohydrate-binding DOMON domain-containing protein